jgi:prepilin-type processing-associated H-X9-DG protein
MRLRSAYTVIELLAVTAILAVLTGLTLAVIQRVRGAAERARCADQLRQIGLALHQLHDTNRGLPPGVTPERRGELYPRLSWHTRLLPLVEQDILWRQTREAFRLEPWPFINPPHLGLATPVLIFGCPSDDPTREPQFSHGRRVALTSFVGVLGTDLFSPDGVLYLGSSVRLTDVTDGTAHTLLVGERPPSADMWYGWWYAGVGQDRTGSADMLLGVRERNVREGYTWMCPSGPYSFRPGRLNNQCDLLHFWSLHPGGAHFLFCDGSVRFLTYDADPLLPALATRAGGEPAALP